jgi:hypothetical protein
MALPKVEYPIYEIYLKSLDKKIKFRPFLVKEEKILLIAKESQDADAIQLAVRQIIQNCAVEEFDVDSLPMFDVEMLFLKLRAKSMGESVKLAFKCENDIPDAEGDGTHPCDVTTPYKLDLDKVDYEIPEGHDSKVMINDTLGVKLKYPTLKDAPIGSTDDEYELMLRSLMANIEWVFDGESVFKLVDATEKEQIEFIESLNREAMDKIESFFRSAPKVALKDSVTCKGCGFVHELYVENLLDFFI